MPRCPHTNPPRRRSDTAVRWSAPRRSRPFGFSDFAFANATFSIDGLANFGVSAARFSAYYLYGLRQVGFGTTGTVNSTGVPGPNGEEIVFAPGAGGDNQPDRLAEGATIDANSPWFAPAVNAGNGNKALIQANNYFPYSAFSGNNWPNPAAGFAYYPYGNYYSATGFAGIRFDTAGGNAKHNGWVRLRLINNGYGSSGGFPTTAQVAWIEALDWAYETTPDAPIQVPSPLDGDYNGDGVVDAADYTVARDAAGENFPLFGRDPNAQGAPEVGESDIAFWASQYGASNASSAAVPEARRRDRTEPGPARHGRRGRPPATTSPANRFLKHSVGDGLATYHGEAGRVVQ